MRKNLKNKVQNMDSRLLNIIGRLAKLEKIKPKQKTKLRKMSKEIRSRKII